MIFFFINLNFKMLKFSGFSIFSLKEKSRLISISNLYATTALSPLPSNKYSIRKNQRETIEQI